MSPTLFREGDFRFFFFSREELTLLDIDIGVESIRDPAAFPLIASAAAV